MCLFLFFSSIVGDELYRRALAVVSSRRRTRKPQKTKADRAAGGVSIGTYTDPQIAQLL